MQNSITNYHVVSCRQKQSVQTLVFATLTDTNSFPPGTIHVTVIKVFPKLLGIFGLRYGSQL